jgi:hypothetical protein
MTNTNPATQATVISALCVLVLACILAAGLWPFHVSRNAVSWSKDRDGLRFERHGVAVSPDPFLTSRAAGDSGFSIEIYLIPAQTKGKGTFLAFDSSPDPRSPFKLSQFGSGLAVQRYSIDEHGKVHQFWYKVPDIFEANQREFVTITSNKNGTSLYLNGLLAGISRDPGIASRELTGRLVVGNSTFNDGWNGEIAGLAIYPQELTPAQVRSHFQLWKSNESSKQILSSSGKSLMALYRFDERAGSVVHNQIDSATDLTIPESYFVLHRTFLRQDFYPQTSGTWAR